MVSLSLSRETVHPPEIFDQYIKSNPNYRIVHKEEQACTSDYVKEAIQTEEVHCSVALELMRHTKWDVFSVQIQTTDAFQHRNWWTLDPSAAGFTEEDYLHAVKLYAHIDNMINKLIQAAGESTLTTIISDHGFCSNKSEIGVNVWLRKNGYLVLNQKKSEIPDKQIKNILKSKIPPLKSLAQFYGRSIQSLRSVLLAGKKQQELFSETVVRHIFI
jgi:predicted AlkP superfamily phosphohydrolase/phosphomutase